METHSLNIRAIYPNRNGELLAGRYADIQLKQKEIEDAIAIPSEAIVPEMGKNKVFVYRSGVADPVDVIIGPSYRSRSTDCTRIVCGWYHPDIGYTAIT